MFRTQTEPSGEIVLSPAPLPGRVIGGFVLAFSLFACAGIVASIVGLTRADEFSLGFVLAPIVLMLAPAALEFVRRRIGAWRWWIDGSSVWRRGGLLVNRDRHVVDLGSVRRAIAGVNVRFYGYRRLTRMVKFELGTGGTAVLDYLEWVDEADLSRLRAAIEVYVPLEGTWSFNVRDQRDAAGGE